MIWEELRTTARKLPYFSEVTLRADSLPTFRNQLSRWSKDGKLWHLRKSLYTLPEDERSAGLSFRLASNVIYSPSYVSLDFMLSLYNLIPERVSEVTAVTSRKTARFQNPLGRFSYRHLKRSAFAGFESLRDENGAPVLVATPEKALLDKVYLDGPAIISKNYFVEGLRLQNFSLLNKERLLQLSHLFHSKKMGTIGALLVSICEEESR